MATVTLEMSTRNKITLDLAAGWSLQTTQTLTDGAESYSVLVYVSATPKRVIYGTRTSTQRSGETRYAGYLDTTATCLTTTLTEIDSLIKELQSPFPEGLQLAQAVRNALAATTVAA